MRVLGVILMAVLLTGLGPPARAEIRLISHTPYRPAAAERLLIRSKAMGGDFIVVITPPGEVIMGGAQPASARPAPEKLPVIYALDGGYGVAGPLAQLAASAAVIRPAYVVSISYPDDQPDRRNTDFLHAAVTEGGATFGGGGARMEAFLVHELRPFLEARYPFDPTRAVLLGHSFGGLFAANVLAHEPHAFAGYIIGSASAWRDPDLTARLAAVAGKGAGRRVVVASGADEGAQMSQATTAIAAALSGPASTFAVQKTLFAGEGHLSSYAPLVRAGLAWTLSPTARTAITVPPERLARLAGVYAYPDGRRITITLKDGALYAALTGLPGETVLLAETPARFFIPGGYDVTFTFEGPESAPAAAVSVLMNGSPSRAPRVEAATT
jgi:predicted alpha/beta superfamily hydrolase